MFEDASHFQRSRTFENEMSHAETFRLMNMFSVILPLNVPTILLLKQFSLITSAYNVNVFDCTASFSLLSSEKLTCLLLLGSLDRSRKKVGLLSGNSEVYIVAALISTMKSDEEVCCKQGH